MAKDLIFLLGLVCYPISPVEERTRPGRKSWSTLTINIETSRMLS